AGPGCAAAPAARAAAWRPPGPRRASVARPAWAWRGGPGGALRAGRSPLDELHLRAGELDQVTVVQMDGIGPHGRAIDGRPHGALDHRDHEAVGPARDG